MGGKFHLKLNISKRPIANKYCEGKMKRTSEGVLKGLEIAEREGNGADATARRSDAVRLAQGGQVSASVRAGGNRSRGGI